MLVSILTHRLVREIESDNSRDIEHHAYNAAVVVFEQWIERGCKFIMNGHHVAQKFCLDFKDFKFDEDLIIDNG